MFTDLSLDVIFHLFGNIIFIQNFSKVIGNSILFLREFSENKKLEISAQREISLLKLTSCPPLASIRSCGVDLYCPDSILNSLFISFLRFSTCINLAVTESRMAPLGLLVITGVVCCIVASHDAF